MLLLAIVVCSVLGAASASCPYLDGKQEGRVPKHNPHSTIHHAFDDELYTTALK
jgi:hypothetical protein